MSIFVDFGRAVASSDGRRYWHRPDVFSLLERPIDKIGQRLGKQMQTDEGSGMLIYNSAENKD
ncbi:hypothetical protein ACCS75_29765 [Rhizobium ruizarguesonis]